MKRCAGARHAAESFLREARIFGPQSLGFPLLWLALHAIGILCFPIAGKAAPCLPTGQATIDFLTEILPKSLTGRFNQSCPIETGGENYFFNGNVEITGDIALGIGTWPIRVEVRRTINNQPILETQGYFNVIVNPPC